MSFTCYAWIGEDEFGSGKVGLKQGHVPAGLVPLVAVERQKLERKKLVEQLGNQVRVYGKTLRLVRLVAVEEVRTIEP